MKAFRYRLQRVLDARDAVVSRCEMMLAETERVIEQRRHTLAGYGDAMRQQSESHAGKLGKQTLKAHEHAVSGAWLSYLAYGVNEASESLARAMVQADERRAELSKAMVGRRILENLAARDRAVWSDDMRRGEQKTLDDQTAARFCRRPAGPLQGTGMEDGS